MSEKKKCRKCKQMFHPDNWGQEYCLDCKASFDDQENWHEEEN